jgi:hypothetical protein
LTIIFKLSTPIKMKKTLLSITMMSTIAFAVNAQTYMPSEGAPLANGEQGVAYAGQTINADIPSTISLSGQDILDALPAAIGALAGAAIDVSASYDISVTSTVLTVAGLPGGLTSDCSGCTVTGGSNRDIVISGTPTEGGTFTVNISSETSGEASIGGFDIPFGGSFIPPGIPVPIPVPALPGVMDADAYTMNVDANGIEEANETFSLGIYPNPTDGISTLDVNSTIAGKAIIEVYSITGSMVQSSVKTIRVGINRLNLDITSVPAGIYLVKADISGSQALVRMQKK